LNNCGDTQITIVNDLTSIKKYFVMSDEEKEALLNKIKNGLITMA